MSPAELHVCTAGDRFDNLEGWLKKLAEQMEKVTELLVESRHAKVTLDDHETRIRVLEKVQATNAVLLRWGERAIWLALAVGAAAYFGG